MPWKILDEKIDGMKPSHFMRHLKSIAPKSTSEDFIKYVWLDQLPGQVKSILLTCPNKSIEELVIAADRITEVTESFKQKKYEFVTMQQFEMLSAEVDKLKKAVKELSEANEKQVNRAGGNYKTCSCESQANNQEQLYEKEGDDQNCSYESQENNQEELNEKEGDDQNCSYESQENNQEELNEKEGDDHNCSFESQENNQEELSEKEGDDQNCSYESQENNQNEVNDNNCSYESQANKQEELNEREEDNQNSSSVSEQSESCDSSVTKLCWYHMCFGKDAHRCVPPCSFNSENK